MFLFLAGLFRPATAQLSPGKLSRAHADLEGLRNCTRCHESGRGVSARLCLDCHRLLKQRIEQGKGLHAQPDYKQCQTCHSEHHGRRFQMIFWPEGEEGFNHELTGFKLEGAHAELKCRDCHKPAFISDPGPLKKAGKDLKQTFLGLKRDCLNCHQDTHRGQLSRNCLKCHSMKDWKPAPNFDHQKTHFPLVGKHRTVACKDCHPTKTDHKYPDQHTYVQFTGLRFDQCSACHEDVHRGKLGKTCDRCHTPRSWTQMRQASFDHSQTRFPLKGRHADLACEKCHKPGVPRGNLKFARCLDCHQDYHQGIFAKRASRGDCVECHSEEGFTPARFSLAKHQKTRFPLEGAHMAVPCNQCHSKVRRTNGEEFVRIRFEPLVCQTCHSDPHQGSVESLVKTAGCQSCHNTEAWEEVTFDHAQTQFPLEGRHATIKCTDCHQPDRKGGGQKLIALRKLSVQCEDCHEDIHLGQFARHKVQGGVTVAFTDCGRCHTPQNWQPSRFDHNRDSRFSLEGAHEQVPCADCHPSEQKGDLTLVRFKPLSTQCRSCHGA